MTAGAELRTAGAQAELRDRFAGRLHFGTAGLRGVVAAGPGGGAAQAGVVVGCDARHRSAEFADEVAGVLAGAGIAVHMLPRPSPG